MKTEHVLLAVLALLVALLAIVDPDLRRLRRLVRSVRQRWSGGVLDARLSDLGSQERRDAEEAVAKVVAKTQVPADCVSATTLQGGPAILVEHDGAKEGFVHRTYDQAADKAIEWVNERDGRKAKFVNTTGLNPARRTRVQRMAKAKIRPKTNSKKFKGRKR